eukprot:TRINITY_DN11982_c0_g1_i1.p1 TRINITY_DN11982_c0_g1~~TRINITY_DN11982_c0_g1_i1.p1  ORF type:complete len:161 (-),score=10.29 TRINITY_DN11982_c0_g1_i1:16-498(-)
MPDKNGGSRRVKKWVAGAFFVVSSLCLGFQAANANGAEMQSCVQPVGRLCNYTNLAQVAVISGWGLTGSTLGLIASALILFLECTRVRPVMGLIVAYFCVVFSSFFNMFAAGYLGMFDATMSTSTYYPRWDAELALEIMSAIIASVLLLIEIGNCYDIEE